MRHREALQTDERYTVLTHGHRQTWTALKLAVQNTPPSTVRLGVEATMATEAP